MLRNIKRGLVLDRINVSHFRSWGGSVELVAFSLGDISYISSSNFMKIISHLVFELSLYVSQ